MRLLLALGLILGLLYYLWKKRGKVSGAEAAATPETQAAPIGTAETPHVVQGISTAPIVTATGPIASIGALPVAPSSVPVLRLAPQQITVSDTPAPLDDVPVVQARPPTQVTAVVVPKPSVAPKPSTAPAPAPIIKPPSVYDPSLAVVASKEGYIAKK